MSVFGDWRIASLVVKTEKLLARKLFESNGILPPRSLNGMAKASSNTGMCYITAHKVICYLGNI